MISKNKLKDLSAYKTQKQCDLDNCFVVEGVKMCDEALKSGWKIHTVCATQPWLEAHEQQVADMDHYALSDAELARLSGQKSPNEVWMLLSRQRPALTAPEGCPLTLALDHLQDPGNLGTILRTADWFGIRRVVCTPDTVSCFNPKVVQSTMGAIFRTEIVYTDLQQYLQQCQIPVYGALLQGDNLYQADLQQRAVLVIGNESKGISAPIAERVTQRLTIPNLGTTGESLNAAVATAILCSEIVSRGK